MISTKNCRGELTAYYDPEQGWVAMVEEPLPELRLQVAAQYIYGINRNRMKGLPPGDKRDHIRRALVDLKTRGITQMIVGEGVTLHAASSRLKPERSFHYAGGPHG